MKTKILYTALIGLLASSGLSNAAEEQMRRLAIMDGNTGSQYGQMTSYQGGAGSSSSLVEGEVIFTDFAQKNVNATLKLSETDYLRLEGSIKYMGQNLGMMTDFLSYLNNYKPGMGTLAPTKEIIVSAEDNLNIDHFSKYFCQNLLFKKFDNQTVTPEEFKVFKSSYDKAFDSYAYENNCILFALTNYLAKSGAQPVEIKHNSKNYSNLRFIFSPCPSTDKEKGTQVNFSFEDSNVPFSPGYGMGKIAKIPEPGTITNYLSSAGMHGNPYDAMYNITLFKVEENTYRINVKLSSKNSSSSSYGSSNDYIDRQISNILLQLKK